MAVLLLGSAAVIAASRVRDYWHNFDDILAGAVVGLAVAALASALHLGRHAIDTPPPLSESGHGEQVDEETPEQQQQVDDSM